MPHNAHMTVSPGLLSNRIPVRSLAPAERWGVRIGSLLPWCVASAVLAYALLGAQGESGGVSASVADSRLQSQQDTLASLFGHQDQAVAAASAPQDAAPASPGRFVLQGTISRLQGGGAAIIAIDGQPGRHVRLGDELVDGWKLASVGVRQAVLQAPGQPELRLEFPASGVTAARSDSSLPAHGSDARPALPEPVAPPVAGTAPAGTGAARPAANIPAETSRMGDGRNDD